MKHFLIKGFYLNLSKRLSVSLTKKKTEAAAAGDMWKKVFWIIFQKSPEKTCVAVSF